MGVGWIKIVIDKIFLNIFIKIWFIWNIIEILISIPEIY